MLQLFSTTLTPPPARFNRKPLAAAANLISKAVCDVRADRPAGDVGTPEIRRSDSDPLKFPKLVQEIQNQAAVDLVDMLHLQSAPEVAKQIGATQVAARMQFMAVDVRAQRHIDIDLVGEGARVAIYPEGGVGTLEALGVEIRRIRGQRNDRAIQSDQVLDVQRGA